MGMIELRIKPEWTVLSQQTAEFRSDPHGHNDGNPAADPEDFYVGEGSQRREKPVQHPIGQEQRIAAGYNDLTDLWRLRNIMNHGLKICFRAQTGLIFPQPSAVTMAAISCTDICDNHQAPVGIAMDQAWYRHIASFLKGIVHAAERKINFI